MLHKSIETTKDNFKVLFSFLWQQKCTLTSKPQPVAYMLLYIMFICTLYVNVDF